MCYNVYNTKEFKFKFQKKNIYVETIYQCCGYCDNMYKFILHQY